MDRAALPLPLLRDALDDAAAAGMSTVRLYGGEPLLHKDIVRVVEHATSRGLKTYITTNGTHLGLKVDELVAAGLRFATIGFYGVGQAYDEYVQRGGHFERLERSLEQVRQRHGSSLGLQLNFVLTRESCSLEAVDAAWAFAERFDMRFHIDLVSFSVPFFNAGPDGALPFRVEDRDLVTAVASRLLALKERDPKRFVHSRTFLRALPDWVILQERMRVPCDAYEMIWIGADGTVQLCDVSFPLGNLHRERLRDILFSAAHRRACADGFQLKCPNCICRVESRTSKHLPSVMKYRALAGDAHGA
jgi:cyclic pyranopterin phosphate synthase